MALASAGVLLFKQDKGLFVLLVHPGGPFWQRRDRGAWSIPKGEYGPEEQAEAAARREVAEEIGKILSGPLLPLGAVRQKGGKRIEAFAAEDDFDPATLVSNRFEMEWPPRSGRRQSFPEIDRAEWFAPDVARDKINVAQRPLLDRLQALLALDRRG